MGGSKTEVNLKRLLAAAPKQQNQQKLIHYVATLREQLEQLAEETTPEGVPRISKAKISDYSKEIEALASKLQAPLSHSDLQPSEELVVGMANENSPTRGEEDQLPGGKKNDISSTQGLRRRFVIHDTAEGEETPIKLDAAAQAQIEKHRQLQENLTDEMVVLARQLKESSLTMNQSLQNTEKRKLWSIAWQALDVPIHGQWTYIRRVFPQHASHGLQSLP